MRTFRAEQFESGDLPGKTFEWRQAVPQEAIFSAKRMRNQAESALRRHFLDHASDIP